MKYKMNNGEKKTDFATRLITEHGKFISAKDAYELVDKRTTTISGWELFQANLSDAVRKGNLAKKKGKDSADRRRTLYGPKGLELLYEPKDMATDGITARKWKPYYNPDKPYFKGDMAKIAYAPPSELSKRLADANKKDKPTFEDIPLGSLLEFNGTTRDDIMSVIEDWLFDTPLYQLRQKYPALETILKELV
jgi:hypothetical protein